QVHGWSVASHEHPWAAYDESGFIDIVVEHDQFSTFRVVIECKRIKADDARQLRWVFLIPDAEFKPTMLASCFEVEGWTTQEDERNVWNDIRVWDNVRLAPESLQSEFCILHSDEQRNRPILEALAREVLTSIEGLAEEEVSLE